jgi:hypothetical protein
MVSILNAKAGQLIWHRCNLHHRYKLRTNYYFHIHSANHICGVMVSVLASSSNSGRVNSKTIKLVCVASPLSKDASMSKSTEEFEDTKGQS